MEVAPSRILGTRMENSQDRHMDISLDNEMEGRRSYVFTLASSSLAWALALVPYWNVYCSNTALSIANTWVDALHLGYILLIISVVILTALSSHCKDAKLSDNSGFKLLQTAQAAVLLILLVGTFVPQHVCRGASNLVVWTCAAGALLLIVLSWALVFQYKRMIKCIKALCQMVIRCTEVMYNVNVQQRLPNLNLPGFISARFKKMLEKKSYPAEPTDPV